MSFSTSRPCRSKYIKGSTKKLEDIGLKKEKCVGQGFDGAPNMAGYLSGTCVRINKIYPKALYVHCASHRLNLAISQAMSVPMLKNALENVERITKLFRKNGHAAFVLENTIKLYAPEKTKHRLIGYCQTRFIERHDCLDLFVEYFEYIAITLQEISEDTSRCISAKASTYLAMIEKSEFIVSVLVSKKVLSLTNYLSILLQEPKLDLMAAIELAKTVVSSAKTMRNNSNENFQEIFNEATSLAKRIFKSDITISRQGRLRNPDVNSVEGFYRVSCFLPGLDNLQQQLENILINNSNLLSSFQYLFPGFAKPENVKNLKKLSIYYEDYCTYSSLEGEYKNWCETSKKLDKKQK